VFSKLIQRNKKNASKQSNLFYICEKSNGFAQIRADLNADPDSTVDRMAGLLAMQCLIHGSNPDNFAILVPAEKILANRLVSRAKVLLQQGRSVATPAPLSSRQREILHSVIRNRANKEIASQLNIAVRTVKFHVSSLLSKFGVENRVELARKALSVLPGNLPEHDSLPLEHSSGGKQDTAHFRDRSLSA
jgi:DNA-binding CsgD family transcriptional regulator